MGKLTAKREQQIRVEAKDRHAPQALTELLEEIEVLRLKLKKTLHDLDILDMGCEAVCKERAELRVEVGRLKEELKTKGAAFSSTID